MEDFEPSPPASQLEPRHKKYYQYMKESSQPKEFSKNRRPNRKRKHIDTAFLKTNMTKSKDSIRKLERHMKDKTCPKSFQYSARANIPPDETFVKDIKTNQRRSRTRLHQRLPTVPQKTPKRPREQT